MALCSGSLPKFVLSLVNLFFILIAIGIIAAGSRKITGDEPTFTLLGFPWNTVATGMIIVGVIMGIISLIGFIAVACESPFLLKTYIYLVSLSIMTLIGVFIIGWLFSEPVTQKARAHFVQLMVNSSDEKQDTTNATWWIEKWQSSAMCCGNMSPADWHNRSLLRSNATQLDTYPASCCAIFNGGVDGLGGAHNRIENKCTKSTLLYHDGCFSDLQIRRYKFLFTNIGIILLLSLLSLLSLASCFECDRQLAQSHLINQQYVAHLNQFMGQPQGAQAGGDGLGTTGNVDHATARRPGRQPRQVPTVDYYYY